MNDKRFPNGEIGQILGFRRSGAFVGSTAIEALAHEAFFETADPAYTPYVPPAPVDMEVAVQGDYAWPNNFYSQVLGFMRVRTLGEFVTGDIGLISDEMLFGETAKGAVSVTQQPQTMAASGIFTAAGGPVIPPVIPFPDIVSSGGGGGSNKVGKFKYISPLIRSVSGNAILICPSRHMVAYGRFQPVTRGSAVVHSSAQRMKCYASRSMNRKNEQELLDLIMLDVA